MKKKIFGVVTAIVIAATVAFSMNINSDANEFSALTMENIEALASGESGGGTNYNICYLSSKVRTGYTYYDCGSCTKVYDEQGKGSQSKCFF